MWEQIDTPLSLGLWLLVKNEQVVDALRVDFDPSRYLESQWKLARDDYQAISFLRKFPFVLEGIDRISAAKEKFLEAEELCRLTNRRFLSTSHRGINPRVEPIIMLARRKIGGWLGNLNGKSWALRCRFGPGVDARNKGARVSAYYKLSCPSVTPEFQEGALALIRSHPAWERILLGFPSEASSREDYLQIDGTTTIQEIRKRVSQKVEVVPGNRVTFVPKTALIDRCIAIEPGMNIFAQLGLGALLRSRLKSRAGLDLNTQVPNQLLAQLGSSFGEIATIDLSSASDTVSTELVRELLPEQWFKAMDWCRSRRGVLQQGSQDIEITYEKFSSMGNGFTFELESMIFYALALSCAEHLKLNTSDILNVRAYGDDITVPVGCVNLLEEVLSFCGFIVNPRKSFSTGVFRESCGADFFDGKNVRPYFLKEFCGTAQSLFRLANGIRRAAYRRNLGFGCDRKLRPVWVHVVDRIPNSLRDLRVPYRSIGGIPWADIESGDGGLAVNHDEALSSPYVRFNTDYMAGWLYAELQACPVVKRVSAEYWDEFYLYSLYASRDGTSSDSTTYDLVVGRGESRRRLNSGAFAPDWLTMGQWL
jgi:hypothetical protein